MFTYYDEKLNRLRDTATGRFAPFTAAYGPDETCPNGCERYGDWWVPEDCPTHMGDNSNPHRAEPERDEESEEIHHCDGCGEDYNILAESHIGHEPERGREDGR